MAENIGGWINENENEVEGRFWDAGKPQNMSNRINWILLNKPSL
jgi:hypothetical protein